MIENEFNQLLIRLFESKLKNYSEITLKVWRDELKDLPDSDIIAGIKKCIRSSDDFVTTAKVRLSAQPDYKMLAEDLIQRMYKSISRGNGFGALTQQEKKIIRSTKYTAEMIGQMSNEFDKRKADQEIKNAFHDHLKKDYETLRIEQK